ncbi:hypothetical protein [Tsuneonella sp. HG222]
MAVKTLPDQMHFRGIAWRLIQPAQVNRSGYTGGRKVMGYLGGRWAAAVEFVPYRDDAEVQAWRGFLASLEGQVHTFFLPAAWDQHGGANPTVTASAGAQTVDLSAAIGLKSGQYMTFGLPSGARQMVVLTADMAGTTAQFRPALREAQAGNTVETVNPYAQVALSAETVGWLAQPGGMFALDGIEVEEAY